MLAGLDYTTIAREATVGNVGHIVPEVGKVCAGGLVASVDTTDIVVLGIIGKDGMTDGRAGKICVRG